VCTALLAVILNAQSSPIPTSAITELKIQESERRRPGAGGHNPELNGDQMKMFNSTKLTFAEVDSVKGEVSGEPGAGLGPSST